MTWQKWSELGTGQRTAVVGVATAELALMLAGWADLARRPAAQVNGRKGPWAAAIAVNVVGPLSYFRWGLRA